eukprot:7942581-Alexandrium_andersonii.AAC.1
MCIRDSRPRVPGVPRSVRRAATDAPPGQRQGQGRQTRPPCNSWRAFACGRRQGFRKGFFPRAVLEVQ